MVAQNPALFLSTGAHSAESFRRLTQTTAFDGEGVVGVDDLQVVQHASGANLTVDVAGGRAFIKGTEAPSTQGTYFVDNQGTVVLTVPTPDSRLDRIDLIAARVRDGSYSGNVHRWDIHYQTGVAAATPTVPEADFNTLVLAEIRVTAGLATVTNTHITDRRTRAFTGFIEPFMVGSIDGADVTGNVVSATTALTANVATTATTAARLGTQRTISLSGDAVGSATFDGSSNVDIEVQSSLTADDIPDLSASKVTSGVFDPARLPAVTLATGPVDATTIDGSGDLNIADKVLFVDASAGFVGINHENPGVALDVTGASWVSGLATFRGGIDAEGNASFDTDTLFIDAANNRVGIGTNVPASTLGIDGILTVAGDTNVTGGLTVAGTTGLAATTVSGGLNVGSGHLRVRTGGNITASEDVTVAGTVTATTAAVTGDLTVGGSELVVDTTAGRVGVGRSPDHDLDVAGTMRVSGDVSMSADLDVTGTITGSIAAGSVTSGMFAQSRIPNLPADQITSGVFLVGLIPNLDASKITSGVLDAARLPPVSGTIGTATNLAGGTVDATTIDGSGDLNIDDGVLFVDVSANRVGIGTETPASTLDVVGSAVVSGTLNTDVLEVTDRAQITDLVLSGTFRGQIGADQITFGVLSQARIPNTDAAKITSGTVAPARIPDLDASKITTGVIDQLRLPPLSGNWDRARTLTVTGDSSGTVTFDGSRDIDLVLDAATLAASDVPTLNASKINRGVLTRARIPTLDASKITSGVLDAARLPPVTGTVGTATNLAGGTVQATTITAEGDVNIDRGVLFVDVSTNRVGINDTTPSVALDVTGDTNITGTLTSSTLTVTGQTTLERLTVTGEFVGDIGASRITSGTLNSARIPSLNASKITAGTLAQARVPNIDATKTTTGVFDGGRIPNLPASKITSGTFGQARLPNLAASKITSGTFTANRIPGLAASKTTSGTFDTARIPNLAANKITGVFAVERIPGLDASKITTGIIDAARLPASTGGGGGSTGSFNNIRANTADIGPIRIDAPVDGNELVTIERPTSGGGAAFTTLDVEGFIQSIAYRGSAVRVQETNSLGMQETTFAAVSSGGAVGMVGIGTETPTKLLDVAGDTNIAGALSVGGNTELAGRISVAQTAILNDVTANTLTVDNTTLVVDSVNNRVGVGTSTPNTTLGVSGTLGVTSNANIVGDLTAGTGAFTVAGSNNRVGINQTAPQHTLDVDGTGRFTGTLRTQNISSFGNLTVSGTTTTTGEVTIGGATSITTGGLSVIGGITGRIDASNISTGVLDAARLPPSTAAHDGSALRASSIRTTGDLAVISGVNGPSRLFVDVSASRVGINDNTPQHSLDVNGTMAVRGASFHTGRAGFGVVNISGDLKVNSTTLVVDVEDGRVGIGTGSPRNDLEVKGTARISGTTGIEGDLIIGEQGLGPGRTSLATFSVFPESGEVSAAAAFFANSITTGQVTIREEHGLNVDGGTFVVDPSQNRVGVGTAAPEVPFHVLGETRLNGDLLVTGAMSATSTLQVGAGDLQIRHNTGDGTVAQPRVWVRATIPPSEGTSIGDLWVDY